jgi:hypothetical protein
MFYHRPARVSRWQVTDSRIRESGKERFGFSLAALADYLAAPTEMQSGRYHNCASPLLLP